MRGGFLSTPRDKARAKAKPVARARGMPEFSFVCFLCVVRSVFVCLRGLHRLKCRRVF